jgi:HK97 family phage portal protein
MSLIDSLKSLVGLESRSNELENPSVSLSSPGAWAWLNNNEPTASGEIINDLTALQLVTVYACIRCIGESVASLPLRLWERNGKQKSEAVNDPLYRILSVEPNPEMTAFSFWESFTGCLALTGNAYAQIARDDSGEITGLWPLNPRHTVPVRLADNSLAYKTSDGMPNGTTRIIAAADMLHCPLYSHDGILGLSPIMQARSTLGLARASEKYGERFFGNSARPGGVLTTEAKLDDKQQALVRDTWQSAQAGANQGKVAVLYGGWKYEALALSPEESQFIGTQEWTRQQISALYRVPIHMLGDTSRLSNNNAIQQNLTFVTDCLRSYLSRIEGEIARKVLSPGMVAQFDISERTRGDFASTMTGLALARQWGFASINDCLETLGQNPIGPEGDVYLYPLNMGNATALVQKTDAADENQPEPIALATYRSAYLSLFRDAVGRTCNRSKRDSASVSATFEPLLTSLADITVTDARSRTGQTDFRHDSAKLIRDHLGKLCERSVSWNLADADQIAAQELTKAMRSLAFNTNRAAVAHSVQKDLETA